MNSVMCLFLKTVGIESDGISVDSANTDFRVEQETIFESLLGTQICHHFSEQTPPRHGKN